MDVDDFSCACSLILTTSNGVTAEKKKFTHCFYLQVHVQVTEMSRLKNCWARDITL